MQWQVFLKKFCSTFHYIKGETNTLADALSCLPLMEAEPCQSTSPRKDNIEYQGHAACTLQSLPTEQYNLFDLPRLDHSIDAFFQRSTIHHC